MSVAIFNLIRDFISIFFSGIVIKATDDYLDQGIDEKIGYFSFAAKLKEGILPYCLIFFSTAIIFNKDLTLALFFASYVIGMFGDMRRKLCFRLKGYQESLMVLALSIVSVGWRLTLFALVTISALQFIDDFIDYREDTVRTCNNFVHRFGKIESGILLSCMILTSIYLAAIYSVMILATYILITSCLFTKARGGSQAL